MAPKPPTLGSAPAKPWHSSIPRKAQESDDGGPEWPQSLKRRGLRPPRTPPAPHSAAPRQSRGAPRARKNPKNSQEFHDGAPRSLKFGGVRASVRRLVERAVRSRPARRERRGEGQSGARGAG